MKGFQNQQLLTFLMLKKNTNLIPSDFNKVLKNLYLTNFFEIKGTGQFISQWFDAELNAEGTYVLSKKGKRDFQSAKQQAESDSSSGGSGGSS